MKWLVLSTTSVGINSSVVITLAGKTAKSSRVICWSKVSWRRLWLAKLMFSMGFRSGVLAGMVNFWVSTSSQADLDFTLFYEGSPSCMESFPFASALFLNMLAKCSGTNEKNFSGFILPWYYSTAITPYLYEIAAIKRATFSPVPPWLFFLVKPKSNPSPGSLQVTALWALAWSKGFIL